MRFFASIHYAPYGAGRSMLRPDGPRNPAGRAGVLKGGLLGLPKNNPLSLPPVYNGLLQCSPLNLYL